MRWYLALSGALLCGLSVLCALSIWRWEIGPEFWPAVPAMAVLGLLMLGEVTR